MTVIDGRGVPRAMFGSIAAVGSRLAAWQSSIERPVSTVHRIGFVQLAPSVGATTLAVEIVRVAAGRRAVAPLAVDLSADGGLAARLGIAASATRLDHGHVRTSAEAESTLVRTEVGAWGARPADAATDPVRAWQRRIAPIMRFHEVIVSDFGTRDPNGDLGSVAALCDVVCVVARAERGPAELARILGEAIDVLPEHPRPVIALVDAARASRRVAQVIAGQTTIPVIRVPQDAGLAEGASALTLPARQALLHLASLLLAARPAGDTSLDTRTPAA